MNKINYQTIMESIITQTCYEDGHLLSQLPTLLLHSCCAPCSSYCLTLLSQYFNVTVFYYNPNIYPPEEYEMRVHEQERFIREYPLANEVKFIEGSYDTNRFYDMARGLKNLPEGGERCFKCYELRLRETAEYALTNGFDFFTTTLSISPLKNSQKLNEIGKKLEEELGIRYLYSDFKKKNGYKTSTEISNEYGMYRQYYCGCVYSKKQRDIEIARKAAEENME